MDGSWEVGGKLNAPCALFERRSEFPAANAVLYLPVLEAR